jgi:hypothetical protein
MIKEPFIFILDLSREILIFVFESTVIINCSSINNVRFSKNGFEMLRALGLTLWFIDAADFLQMP